MHPLTLSKAEEMGEHSAHPVEGGGQTGSARLKGNFHTSMPNGTILPSAHDGRAPEATIVLHARTSLVATTGNKRLYVYEVRHYFRTAPTRSCQPSSIQGASTIEICELSAFPVEP